MFVSKWKAYQLILVLMQYWRIWRLMYYYSTVRIKNYDSELEIKEIIVNRTQIIKVEIELNEEMNSALNCNYQENSKEHVVSWKIRTKAYDLGISIEFIAAESKETLTVLPFNLYECGKSTISVCF